MSEETVAVNTETGEGMTEQEVKHELANDRNPTVTMTLADINHIFNPNAFIIPFIGQYCLIRTYASGVHAGILNNAESNYVVLADSRRLWKWKAVKGISLSDVSIHGIVDAESKICETVSRIYIADVLEIIPMCPKGADTVMNATIAPQESS